MTVTTATTPRTNKHTPIITLFHTSQVELGAGLTRGMTVVDTRGEVFPPDRPKRPANCHVAVEVDAAALKVVFAEAVLRAL